MSPPAPRRLPPALHLIASLALPSHILDSPVLFLTLDLALLREPCENPSPLRREAAARALALDEQDPFPLDAEELCSWLATACEPFMTRRGLGLFDLDTVRSGASFWADAGFAPASIDGPEPGLEPCASALSEGLEDFAAALGLPPHCLSRQDPRDPRYPCDLLPELSAAFFAGQERDSLLPLPQAPRARRPGL